MKITREFNPVTITLEYEYELELLQTLLSRGHYECVDKQTLSYEEAQLTDFYCKFLRELKGKTGE